MPLVYFSFEHGRSLEEAKAKLRQVADELQKRLLLLVTRVEWAANGASVLIAGTGFQFKIGVDERMIHVEGDIPWIAKLLGSPAVAKVKQVIEQAFDKRIKD